MRRDSGHCRAQRAQRDSRLYRGHALGVTRFSRSGAVRLSIYMGYYAALGGSGLPFVHSHPGAAARRRRN